MKKTIAFILAAVMLTACRQVPSEVKEKYDPSSQAQTQSGSESSVNTKHSSQSSADTKIEKVDISQLDEYSKKLGEYIKQKGYDKNFSLPENLKTTTPKELYTFTMKQANGAQEKFPQVYDYCFGRDFEKDSGVSDISKLPLSDGKKDLSGFNHVKTELYDSVRYIDSKGFNKETNNYITGLNVTDTGFINFCSGYDSYAYDAYSACKQVYYSKGESSSEQFLMTDGSRYSCDEAKSYAEKYLNGLISIYNTVLEYKIKLIEAAKNDEGRHLFEITFQEYYKGTPLSDLMTNSYHDPIHTKMIHSSCIISGREKLIELNMPYGFETLESSEKVTEKLLPVTKAVDIMHEKLAEYIRLDIFDVKLIYFNEYDGSGFEKAYEEWTASGNPPMTSLPAHVQKELNQPEMNENNVYKCYPAWVFYIPSQNKQQNKFGITEIEFHSSYIVVNALTGEMKDYIDPSAAHI